jgi:hypothetical protein
MDSHKQNAGSTSQTSGQESSKVVSTPNSVSGKSNMATSGSSTEGSPSSKNMGSTATSSSSASASASATVNLTTQQKTEIHNTIINNHNAPRVQNLNINVGAGSVVPPSVTFAPLPAAIASIEPAWRGLYYFLYGERIVLVDPKTRRIVAVVVV